MLYSLLTAVIVLSVAMPIVGVWCFIKGYNVVSVKNEEKPIVVRKPRLKSHKAPTGDKNTEILLANIEAYDGTSNGQKDFE